METILYLIFFILIFGLLSSVVFAFAVSIITLVVIAIAIIYKRKKEYQRFVLNHSEALEILKQINNKYDFSAPSSFSLYKQYDYYYSYRDINPKDYLIYYLATQKRSFRKEIEAADKNIRKYSAYAKEINSTIHLGKYDAVPPHDNYSAVKKVEKTIVKNQIKKRPSNYHIYVEIDYIHRNGYIKSRKSKRFYIKDIYSAMNSVGTSWNGRYSDSVWNSLTKVERGKVTLSMREKVFARDNYRCRYCKTKGSANNRLEVDHIYPISKGGKSTLNNLQTLCHRCNQKKGAKVISRL